MATEQTQATAPTSLLATPPANTVTEAAPPADAPADPPKPSDAPAEAPPAEKSTEDKPVEGDKPKDEPPKAAEAKDAPLEVTFPEGFEIDAALVDEFKTTAKELGLKSEQAQKLVDIQIRQKQAELAQAETYVATVQSAWEKELKADPEFGGQKFDANVNIARRAIAKFGDQALFDALSDPLVGSNPALVRAFHRIGMALGEDSIAGTHPAPNSVSDEESRLRRDYPTMFTTAG